MDYMYEYDGDEYDWGEMDEDWKRKKKPDEKKPDVDEETAMMCSGVCAYFDCIPEGKNCFV